MRQNKARLNLPAQASARAVFCHSMRLNLATDFYALRIANWQLMGRLHMGRLHMGRLHMGGLRTSPRQWLCNYSMSA